MSDTRLDRTTNLLSDAPADEDAFKGGGHERVANALASLIRDEEGGKAVALQGPYGSGKSTVIEILDDKIEDDGETRIFTCDAWEHQGDPEKHVDAQGAIRSHLEDVAHSIGVDLSEDDDNSDSEE
jgi:ABC-type transporter Mla maintaining outer membrane lipid asymmetry ATPase subunit MlaF